MTQPKISVVTVCYNAAETIEGTMLSVINQTYKNIEYIIIDGGSTDGTVDIIRKYADRIAYWVSEPDKGIYDAMNKGIKVATGEWINFMNAGDRYAANDTLLKCLPYFQEKKDIISGIAFLDKLKWYAPKESDLSVTFFLKKSLNHQATFIKRDLFKDRLYDTDLKIASDSIFFFYSLILRDVSYLDIPVEVAVCEKPGASSMEQDSYQELVTTIRTMLPQRMNADIDFLITCNNPVVRTFGGTLYRCKVLRKLLRYLKSLRTVKR